jgi:hypothetical protein
MASMHTNWQGHTAEKPTWFAATAEVPPGHAGQAYPAGQSDGASLDRAIVRRMPLLLPLPLLLQTRTKNLVAL